MLPLLLAVCLTAPLPDDVVTLQHATLHETTLGPEDSILEGIGPSKTFRYELEADDSVLFIWAASDQADLLLWAEFGGPTSVGKSDSKPSGAATLFASKPRVESFTDDDSGGGTTPFLRLERMGGGTLTIQVAAKPPHTDSPLTVHFFEARETAGTRTAAAAGEAAIEESKRLGSAGDLDSARSTLSEALTAMLGTEGRPSSAAIEQTAWNIGYSTYGLSDQHATNTAWAFAHDFRSRTLPEDHPDLQAARLNLALTIRALGDLHGARALEEQALAVLSRTLPEDHPNLQRARGNLAMTMFDLGDLPGARSLFEQVLSVRSRTLPEDHPDLQAAREHLAATMWALGDLPGARALQQQVLAIRSRTLPEDHLDLQAARGNLAMTMYDLGDLPGARALQQQVLAVRSRTQPEDHPDLQAARGNLALTMYDLGDLPGARALQEQVLAVLSRTLPEDHPHLQAARGNLANTMSALGDLPGARTLQEQVLAVRSRALPEDHPDLQRARASAARSRALAREALGSRRLARDLAATSGSQSPERFLERPRQSEFALDTTLSICAGAGVFEPDPEGERLAFEMVEAERGADRVVARSERSLAGDSEGARLREEISRASRRLSELAGGEESSSALSDLVRERDALRRALRSRLEETEAARLLPDLDPKKIARQMADEEVALALWRYHRWTIDPETSKEETTASYLAWVLRPDGALRRIELGSAVVIEDAIDDWRTALGAPTRGITQDENRSEADPGLIVRRLLIDPLEEAIGEAHRLWLAPAEALHLVPFEALPIEGGVLGDRFEIVQLGALSELTVDDPTPLSPVSVLAFGGISYDGEAAPFAEGGKATSRGAVLRGSSSAPFEWTFGRLPSTRGEAEVVGEYFLDAYEDEDAPEPTILTRRKASRDAFEALAPKHRFLHLATHGWFAPESVTSTADDRVIDEAMGVMGSLLLDQVRGLAPSLLCGLAFAGANGEADMYGRVRGVMTAEEISAMDLTGVELCVLSACETNVGLRRGGQGIASLQTALHAAGVRTAITSLWKVPDEATRELMTEFYRRLWVLKEPKAKALWNAKRKLREQLDGEGKPIYSIRDWAGWVLSGDPD